MDSLLAMFLLIGVALVSGIWLADRRRQDLVRSLKSAQKDLRRVSLQRDMVTQSVDEGIIAIDTAEQISFISKTAQEILGDGKHTLAQVERIFGIEPLVREVLDHHADLLAQTVAKDERIFQVSVHAFPKNSQNAALIVIREVTELQRLGRVRRDFIANISHELRTPVTSLRLLTDTLSKELATNPALVAELVAKLRQQVDVLHQLADEMMSLALIESGQMPIRLIEVRLNDLVEATLEILRTQAELKHVTIEVQIDKELCALADPDGMRKVFNNLIHNAIKFTPAQGRITISAIQVGENIQMQIADMGIGIPARDLPRIFERFYKTDQARAASGVRGTGLGLAIAKHIVEGHGGRIWAESVEGKGSTFYFTLPTCER
ncbi:MAG: PAS domain-containing sensor histidine kinase [Chloroflexi bacterium]|nr:PAS domain-containing sensor histidine kinase [Chloroflexota bacterium]